MYGKLMPDNKGVSIIVSPGSFKNPEKVFCNYTRQEFKNKELIIAVNDGPESFDLWISASRKHPMVRVYEMLAGMSYGECLNYCIGQSIYEYIAIFHENHFYGSGYLINSVNRLCTTGAWLLGKKTYLSSDENLNIQSLVSEGFENCFTDYVILPTFVFDSRLHKEVKFKDSNTELDLEFCMDMGEHGFTVYSSDRKDYLYCN